MLKSVQTKQTRANDGYEGDDGHPPRRDQSLLSSMERSQKAAAHDERIYRERKSKFYGTARVLLSSLHFPTEDSLLSLPRPKKDVKRLKRVIQKEDCYRLADDEHHVSALISQLQLDAALRRADKSLQDLNSKEIPPIIEPSSPLQCIHGKSRLQAVGSSDVLDDGDRWWAVDLYAEGTASSAHSPPRMLTSPYRCES